MAEVVGLIASIATIIDFSFTTAQKLHRLARDVASHAQRITRLARHVESDKRVLARLKLSIEADEGTGIEMKLSLKEDLQLATDNCHSLLKEIDGACQRSSTESRLLSIVRRVRYSLFDEAGVATLQASLSQCEAEITLILAIQWRTDAAEMHREVLELLALHADTLRHASVLSIAEAVEFALPIPPELEGGPLPEVSSEGPVSVTLEESRAEIQPQDTSRRRTPSDGLPTGSPVDEHHVASAEESSCHASLRASVEASLGSDDWRQRTNSDHFTSSPNDRLLTSTERGRRRQSSLESQSLVRGGSRRGRSSSALHAQQPVDSGNARDRAVPRVLQGFSIRSRENQPRRQQRAVSTHIKGVANQDWPRSAPQARRAMRPERSRWLNSDYWQASDGAIYDRWSRHVQPLNKPTFCTARRGLLRKRNEWTIEVAPVHWSTLSNLVAKPGTVLPIAQLD